MKKEVLERSSSLASQFARYTEADPLLSLKQAEFLISHHSLGHKIRIKPITKIMMTLTGAIIAIAFFAINFQPRPSEQATPLPRATQGINTTIEEPSASIKPIEQEPAAVEAIKRESQSHERRQPVSSSAAVEADADASLADYYQLTDQQLANIGLVNEGLLVTYYYRRSSSNIGCLGIFRKWGAMLKERPLPEGINAPNITPTFVTDGLGRKRSSTYKNKQDAEENERKYLDVNSLVPVIVREKDGAGPLDSLDLIFWYLPSEELFTLLPDSISKVAQAQTSNGGQSTVHSRERDRAVLSASVYPNPSPGKLSLALELEKGQKVMLSLRDLMGRAAAPSSLHEVPSQGTVDLKYDVADGIYLLEITPQHGEPVIRRIVIQK
jgi:hypothetical protein